MKHTLLLLLISVISLPALAQFSPSKTAPELPRSEETGDIAYEGMWDVDYEDPAHLYEDIHRWFLAYFKNPHGVMKEKDAENFIIKGEHAFYLYRMVKKTKAKSGLIKYRLEMWADEDANFHYRLYHINLDKNVYWGAEKFYNKSDKNYKQNFNFLEQIDVQMNDILSSLKKNLRYTEE